LSLWTRLLIKYRVWQRMRAAGPVRVHAVPVLDVGLGSGSFVCLAMTIETYRAFSVVEETLYLDPERCESDRFGKFYTELLLLAQVGELMPSSVYMLLHPEGYGLIAQLDALEDELADEDDYDDLEEVELDFEEDEE
jgi:hypothetical protein